LGTGIFNKLNIWNEDEKIAFKKKALIFGFFLLIAVVIWFMNILSNNYTAEIKYPVRYFNYPSQKMEIGNPPEELTIKVNAQGYTLLRFQLSSKYSSLNFNLNSFTMYRLPGSDSSVFYLQTSYARDYIRNQLSRDFELISIEPDTLFFRFANIRSKYVPVKPSFTYQLGKQMIHKSPLLIMPDSVLVSGPDFIIDTLSQLETMPDELGVISRSKEFVIKMKQLEYLMIKTENIHVSFNIEQFTEKTIQVPVTASNLPEKIELRTFPPAVQLTCRVGLSNYEKLQSSSFKAQVDYNEITRSETGKLKVEVVKQPEFVTAVSFLPKTVEYLIEK